MGWVAPSLASGVLVALSVFSTPHRWWAAQEEVAPRKLAEKLEYDTLPKEAFSTFSNYSADGNVEAQARSLTDTGNGVAKKDVFQSWILAMVSGKIRNPGTSDELDRLVTSHADNFLRIWDVNPDTSNGFPNSRGQIHPKLIGKIDVSSGLNYGVNGLFAMDADFAEERVLVGANDGTAFLFELKDNGRLLKTLFRGSYTAKWKCSGYRESNMKESGTDAGHIEPVNVVKLNMAQNQALTAGNTIKLWDLNADPPTVIRTLHCVAGYDCKIKGKGTVQNWGSGTGTAWSHGPITSMEVGPWDSGQVVTGHSFTYCGTQRFQSLKTWDFKTGEQTTPLDYTAAKAKKGSSMYDIYNDVKAIQVDFESGWAFSSRSRYGILPLKEDGEYKPGTSGVQMGVGTKVYAYGNDAEGRTKWYAKYDKDTAKADGATWWRDNKSPPSGSESGAEIYAMCADFSEEAKLSCKSGVLYTGDYNGVINKFCVKSGTYYAKATLKLEAGEKIRSCALLGDGAERRIAFGTFMKYDEKNQKGGSLRIVSMNAYNDDDPIGLVERLEPWNRDFTKSDDKAR